MKTPTSLRAILHFGAAPLLAGILAGACTVRTTGFPVVVHAVPPPPARVRYVAASPPQAQPQPQYAPPGQAAPPPQMPCIDPGDRDLPDLFDSPLPIQSSSTTVACTFRGDADLFAVTVPPGAAGQVVRYRLRGQFEMAPKLDVFNANRKRILYSASGPREELTGWIYVAGGTRILLRVTQVHGVNEAYTLALVTAPLPDPTEPNDSAEQATRLVPGTPVSGFMANPANSDTALSDWYRIDVAQDGPLAFDIDLSQDSAVTAQLFESFSRRMIKQQSASRGERFRFQATVRRGTYNLFLRSVHRVDEAAAGEPPPSMTRPYVIAIVP